MTTRILETVIYLISCAVKGTRPEQERLAGVDFGALLSFASYHMLGTAVAKGLVDAGFSDKSFRKNIAFSVRKNTYLETANREVLAGIEGAGVSACGRCPTMTYCWTGQKRRT